MSCCLLAILSTSPAYLLFSHTFWQFWGFCELCSPGNPVKLSQLRYTANTPMDYGTVSCSVAAEMTEGDRGIGAGRPCVYHIVPAGKDVYRVEQLDLTPEMEVFHMLFERCHTKKRKRSIKQDTQYFNFRSEVLLDHPVLLKMT